MEDLERKNEDYIDENGIRTTVEYVINEDGKKVKITRKIKRTLQKSIVDHNVAERQKWAKFGKERGNKPGPDRATTTVGETVALQMSAGNKMSEVESQQEEAAKKPKVGRQVVCRLCKGEHFTAKCPYKDRLSEMDSDLLPPEDDLPPLDTVPNGPAATSGGPSKYIPLHMRPGAGRGQGESMRGPGNRDDLPTLRVTNISEDVQEQDLRDLFGVFGRVARVYVGRDRETGVGKGFAFVSFEERSIAQKAMEKLNGRGYDNLILSVQWSQPRADQK